MATLLQLRTAYVRILKAQNKLRDAIRAGENAGLLATKDVKYEDGYYGHLNELEYKIEDFAKKPLADALLSDIRHESWKK